jgi:hypothetical protein
MRLLLSLVTAIICAARPAAMGRSGVGAGLFSLRVAVGRRPRRAAAGGSGAVATGFLNQSIFFSVIPLLHVKASIFEEQ